MEGTGVLGVRRVGPGVVGLFLRRVPGVAVSGRDGPVIVLTLVGIAYEVLERVRTEVSRIDVVRLSVP